MVKEFELVPHTADLQIQAYGSTFEELFKNALKGMFSSIKPQGPEISYHQDIPHITHFTVKHVIQVHSPNRELLLIDFLSECLYLSDIHDEAYFDAYFNVLHETDLEGLIYGIKITGFEETEIKAVTYHANTIEELNGELQATIVFDI
jgi:SHS2 domain-containing protein